MVSLGEDARECWDGSLNTLKIRARLALAEIGKCPDRVTDERRICLSSVNKVTDFVKYTLIKKGLTEASVVTSDVSNTPDSLLLDLNMRVCAHNIYQDFYGTLLDKFKDELAFA